MQKSRRIRTSGTSDENDITPDKQFVIPHGTLDEAPQRRRMGTTITPRQISLGQTSFRAQRSSNALQKVTSEA